MKTKLKIGNIDVRAQRKGAPEGFVGTVWYEISAESAKKIMRDIFPGKRVPRPGYCVDLPDTKYDGYEGHWLLSNYAGKYELQFIFE